MCVCAYLSSAIRKLVVSYLLMRHETLRLVVSAMRISVQISCLANAHLARRTVCRLFSAVRIAQMASANLLITILIWLNFISIRHTCKSTTTIQTYTHTYISHQKVLSQQQSKRCDKHSQRQRQTQRQSDCDAATWGNVQENANSVLYLISWAEKRVVSATLIFVLASFTANTRDFSRGVRYAFPFPFHPLAHRSFPIGFDSHTYLFSMWYLPLEHIFICINKFLYIINIANSWREAGQQPREAYTKQQQDQEQQ